jgi:hypothetical protein
MIVSINISFSLLIISPITPFQLSFSLTFSPFLHIAIIFDDAIIIFITPAMPAED